MSPLPEVKPSSLNGKLEFPSLVKTLGGFFASREESVYLVGGVVRDALLGRPTSDVDMALSGGSRQVGAELAGFLSGHFVVLDERRDTVRVVVPGDDGGGSIDLSPLRGSVGADLRRRDFTVDAMAIPLDAASGAAASHLIDPHGGLADLRSGVIRALSPEVFDADPVRLMRAPRLAAQLRFQVSDDTETWIRQRASQVGAAAPERVRDELMKLLAAPAPASSLGLLDRLGLLCEIVPELSEARGVSQPKEHHLDVFDHLIETAGRVAWLLDGASEEGGYVAELTPTFPTQKEYFAEEVSDGCTRSALLELAGLLHDIAKPATKTIEEGGRVRFLGHADLGAEMSERILRRLRFSQRGIGMVSDMVKHHLRPSQMSQGDELPTRRAVYRFYRDVGEVAVDTLYLNLADYLAARGPLLSESEWTDHCNIVGHTLRRGLTSEAPEPPPMLINGNDIMKTFSLPPGPHIGRYLELVREAQGGGDIESRQEALELIKSTMREGVDGA